MISFSEDGSIEEISGNACKRGEIYAHQECIMPLRMITAVIKIEGSDIPLSVKTTAPVPKNQIKLVMRELASVSIQAPISIGSVVIHNVLGLDVDIVATRNID